jgi:hypothetical protein
MVLLGGLVYVIFKGIQARKQAEQASCELG